MHDASCSRAQSLVGSSAVVRTTRAMQTVLQQRQLLSCDVLTLGVSALCKRQRCVWRSERRRFKLSGNSSPTAAGALLSHAAAAVAAGAALAAAPVLLPARAFRIAFGGTFSQIPESPWKVETRLRFRRARADPARCGAVRRSPRCRQWG